MKKRKLIIHIGNFNDSGTSCSISDMNADMDSTVNLVRTTKKNPKEACLLAATKLRELAERFEKLAKKKNPKMISPQMRINGLKKR